MDTYGYGQGKDTFKEKKKALYVACESRNSEYFVLA